MGAQPPGDRALGPVPLWFSLGVRFVLLKNPLLSRGLELLCKMYSHHQNSFPYLKHLVEPLHGVMVRSLAFQSNRFVGGGVD